MSAPNGGFAYVITACAKPLPGRLSCGPSPHWYAVFGLNKYVPCAITFGVICSSAAMSFTHKLRPCVAAISS